MNRRGVLALIGCLALVAACAKPLPPERAAYVGEWKSPEMYLLITQDGTVHYERLKGGGTVTVTGPLQKFEGDNFSVGLGFMSTTFVVTKPPFQKDGRWRMVVDGVELSRRRGGQAPSGEAQT